MSTKLFLGIDIGSTSTEAVVVDNHLNLVTYKIISTDPNHKECTSKILDLVLCECSRILNREVTLKDISYCLGTGYGRKNIFCAENAITEISCHAKGVHYFFPQTRTIIDIGGQDSKVISIDEQGDIIDFVMNEKCAAGTGRFFEVLCDILEVKLDDIGPISLQADQAAKISSMCTVFAESEIISKIAEGCSRESIIKGLHSAIFFRVLSMAKRVGINKPVVFTGGVAKNIGMVHMLYEQTGLTEKDILIPSNPQITGALGAAILAHYEYEKKLRDLISPLAVFNLLEEELSEVELKPDVPVIGWTDLSVPVELFQAAGLKNMRIRGDIEKGSSSDQFLPTYSCAYIKNSISSLLEGSRRYQYLSGVVSTNCCTATEKMADVLAYYKEFSDYFIYNLNVPRRDNDTALNYMKKNIIRLKELLEKRFNVEISERKLREVCGQFNLAKKLITDYSKLLSLKNIPNAAHIIAIIMEKMWTQMDITDDFILDLKKEIKKLESIESFKKRGINILLSGSIIPDSSFYTIFHDTNCQLIYNHTSSGSKFSDSLVDLEDKDIYLAIAKRCLYSGYGPRMMEMERIGKLKEIIDTYSVEAIIFNITKFCVHYTFDAVVLKQYCEEWNIPLLIIETDFTNKGFGQLKTRIEAFVEMFGGVQE